MPNLSIAAVLVLLVVNATVALGEADSADFAREGRKLSMLRGNAREQQLSIGLIAAGGCLAFVAAALMIGGAVNAARAADRSIPVAEPLELSTAADASGDGPAAAKKSS
eukprot:CAMPEP_0171517318 /NCGR_PEP_ID=MMETSP0959-20130129/4597_1 /TAXON_ID=87120 /ORGANISM="Aurantiochytrium limacinum, Strain ATCCMYA-1381" /LENGTH=108 /DNA_ID=CAMNT_0012056269 /DNA_START=596 /DNA_END=919 /DNA_ORIENTATION=+